MSEFQCLAETVGYGIRCRWLTEPSLLNLRFFIVSAGKRRFFFLTCGGRTFKTAVLKSSLSYIHLEMKTCHVGVWKVILLHIRHHGDCIPRGCTLIVADTLKWITAYRSERRRRLAMYNTLWAHGLWNRFYEAFVQGTVLLFSYSSCSFFCILYGGKCFVSIFHLGRFYTRDVHKNICQLCFVLTSISFCLPNFNFTAAVFL